MKQAELSPRSQQDERKDDARTMPRWKKFTNETRDVEPGDIVSKYIVNWLGSLSQQLNAKKPPETTLIQDALSELGDKDFPGKPKFKTYANRLSPHLRQCNGGKYKNREWLYDHHWYTEAPEPNHYLPISLDLVAECEWRHARRGDGGVPYGEIKYDFQKLLAANADLRLMIFKITNDMQLSELDNYFDQAIATYRNLAEKSKFLFIAFDSRIVGFHYTEKLKG